MSCQSISPFGDVCYYDDDPPGILGSSCEEPTDCGAYICDRGVCVTPCDLAVGQGCPDSFECAASSASDDTYYCYPLDTGDGGCGCRTTGADAPLAMALALGLALWSRRRKTLR
jgi:MYXO-CTERM domain-containing protein